MRQTVLGRLAISAAAVALAGCGGKNGSSSSDSSTITEFSIGDAKIGFAAKPRSTVAAVSNNITVNGLSGTAFSFVDFYPTPTIAATQLAFIRNGQVWTYSFATHIATQISNILGAAAGSPYYATSPSWGNAGQIMYGLVFAGTSTVNWMFNDGSHPYQITSPTGVQWFPAWSPNSSQIAGLDSNRKFVLMNFNGSGVTTLDASTNIDFPNFSCFWASSNTLIYNRKDAADSNFDFPFTVKTTSPSPSILSDGSSGLYPTNPSTDPSFAAYAAQTASSLPIVLIHSASVLEYLNVTPSGYSDSYPVFSPDGRILAVYRQLTTGQFDGVSGIYTMTTSAENPVQIVADPVTGGQSYLSAASNLAWSPFPKYKRFAGTGGTLGTTSSGFLFSQIGSVFGSIFSFTAKTPSTAVIAAPTGSGNGSALVFSIAADAITSFTYENGYYFPANAVTATTGTTNMVVSFDSTTGQVDLVAPAIESKQVARTSAGTISYTGKFAGIYDAKGNNIAPQGAVALTIDGKTGKLLSHR